MEDRWKGFEKKEEEWEEGRCSGCWCSVDGGRGGGQCFSAGQKIGLVCCGCTGREMERGRNAERRDVRGDRENADEEEKRRKKKKKKKKEKRGGFSTGTTGGEAWPCRCCRHGRLAAVSGRGCWEWTGLWMAMEVVSVTWV